jgi:tRNA-specific 2-thiouridylase
MSVLLAASPPTTQTYSLFQGEVLDVATALGMVGTIDNAMAKILVAMSGGVDSSLTAALLYEQGHEVIGVTMHLWDDDDERLAESLCCASDMAESARRVAAQIGIPYYVFNYQQEFRHYVIDYFLREYTQGYTPNPCMECNREIKFRALLARARKLGYSHVATGHYAQIATRTDAVSPRYALQRAVDRDKDQSYMLHMLTQDDLARLYFPLGGLSKREVREMAAARGLASAERPESQDICFVPNGDYRNLLREEAPESLEPGPIVDLEGREIGRHAGLPLYTVGQRRGLGLAGGRPLYVVALDPGRNALVVGPAEAIINDSFRVDQAGFVDGAAPSTGFGCRVQIRAHSVSAPAQVTPQPDGTLHVQMHEPLRAISPGQSAVFYDHDDQRVLGGGRIMRPAAVLQTLPERKVEQP